MVGGRAMHRTEHRPCKPYRQRWLALFDHDGTLVNSLGLVVAASNSVRCAYGHEPAPAEHIIAGMIWPTAPRMGLLLNEADPSRCALYAQQFYAAALRLAPNYARLYPGMQRLCCRLITDGWQLGMVTNNQGALARQVLAQQGVGELFSIVLGEEDVLRPKPATDGIETALRRLGGSRHRCVFIGDSAADADAARAASVPSVGVTWGTHHGQQLADHSFSCLAATAPALMRRLQQIRGSHSW